MIQWIGFDADDTLWDYEIIYQQAKEKIAQILGGQILGDDFAVDDFLTQLDEFEVQNIPLFGYGIKSYGLSLIELLASTAPDPIEPKILADLISMIKDMLNTKFRISPYAVDTLARLSKNYALILITKGEGYEQERKIESSGLAKFFNQVEVVSQKTEATYRKILDTYQISTENFLMVGNSLKSDIVPVVNIGASAVHIPHKVAWFHEEVPADELGSLKYEQLDHLGQLAAYVETFAKEE